MSFMFEKSGHNFWPGVYYHDVFYNSYPRIFPFHWPIHNLIFATCCSNIMQINFKCDFPPCSFLAGDRNFEWIQLKSLGICHFNPFSVQMYFFFNFKHYSDVIVGTMASQITSLTSVYSTVYSGADQRKHQGSASLAFASNAEMLPFDDVIMRPSDCLSIFNWHHDRK